MAPLTPRAVASIFKNNIEAIKPEPLSRRLDQNHYPKTHGLHWDVIVSLSSLLWVFLLTSFKTVLIGLGVIISIIFFVYLIVKCTDKLEARRRRREGREREKRKHDAKRMQDIVRAKEKAREMAWSESSGSLAELGEIPKCTKNGGGEGK